MPEPTPWRLAGAAALVLALGWAPAVRAQAPQAEPPPQNSAMDAPMFYQLLIGELELRQGEPGAAFEVILDAARRSRDEQVFRRAVEIALQARAGDQALTASRAWRQAAPKSTDALLMQLQILSALNRVSEMGEPLRSLLQQSPEAERAGLIASIPRFLQRAPDKHQAAQLVETVLEPHLRTPATRATSLVAIGRAWLSADEPDRALERASQAQAADPAAPGPALLALDLMAKRPAAEALVKANLARPEAEPAMRMTYVRALMSAQRLGDAIGQVEMVTKAKPDMPQAWITLGALQLEMRQPKAAEAALLRYVQLVEATPEAAAAADDDDDADADARPGQRLVQAWLLLAQAAEQRQDFAAAETWLGRIDDPKRALDVQVRRANLLVRQGRVTQARELVRRVPEREPGDARAKLLAEAGVLREAKQWSDAYDVMATAAQRFPDDSDLLYEQAMVAERLNRLDDMERLLRRVIELKPDNAHAHNALGYSLADRRLRLPEARTLIQRALELSPGDPFITDSLGWVEFRMGNLPEALRLLRQAYASRPDVEIGAHLGEVLWAAGQQDEARRIWAESKGRDATNDVLRETLARLKVSL